MNKTGYGWSKTIKKIISSILVFVSVFVMGANKSLAATTDAPTTIQMGEAESQMTYIGAITFPIKYMTNHAITYCLDHNLGLVENQTLTNKGALDAGITYIMKNGYPFVRYVDGGLKDYYITQTALWWYLDETSGTNNFKKDPSFKTTAYDQYGLRQYIVALKNAALNHRNYESLTADITVGGKTLSLSSDGNYYVSNSISLYPTSNSTGYVSNDNYIVSLKNAPAGTIITDRYGNQTNSIGINDSFIVKVPASSVSNGTTTFEVNTVAKGIIEKAYKFSPTDSSIQSVTTATTFNEKIDIPSSIALSITKTTTPPTPDVWTSVSILKKDAITGQALAGADLVIKNASGAIVYQFTSTTSAHNITNILPAGNYTLEETKAPAGYILSTEKVPFTVVYNTTVPVEIKNAKTTVFKFEKKDAETGALLAHAMIVIKDKDGNEVAKFESTNEPHYIYDLKPGTYTLQETSAPEGYVLNDKPVTFTIEAGSYKELSLPNSKYIDVPKTAAADSIIIYIVGAIITLGSAGMIFSGVKKVY